jgi:hypothetical protein
MMIGFTAKGAIVLLRRFGWRCSRMALDRHRSAFAVGQNVSLPLLLPRRFLQIAARAVKSAPQLFAWTPLLMRPPRMLGRTASFRFLLAIMLRDSVLFIDALFI